METFPQDRILLEGGWVHSNNNSSKIINTIEKVGLITSAIIFLSSIVLLTFVKNKGWGYIGIVASVGLTAFMLSRVLDNHLSKKDFYVSPSNGKHPYEGELGSYGWAGITLDGHFRRVGNTYVCYKCLTFLVPIVPLACYRVINEGTHSTLYNEKTTFYRILGSEKRNHLEIAQLYLESYGLYTMIGCLIAILCMLF